MLGDLDRLALGIVGAYGIVVGCSARYEGPGNGKPLVSRVKRGISNLVLPAARGLNPRTLRRPIQAVLSLVTSSGS